MSGTPGDSVTYPTEFGSDGDSGFLRGVTSADQLKKLENGQWEITGANGKTMTLDPKQAYINLLPPKDFADFQVKKPYYDALTKYQTGRNEAGVTRAEIGADARVEAAGLGADSRVDAAGIRAQGGVDAAGVRAAGRGTGTRGTGSTGIVAGAACSRVRYFGDKSWHAQGAERCTRSPVGIACPKARRQAGGGFACRRLSAARPHPVSATLLCASSQTSRGTLL